MAENYSDLIPRILRELPGCEVSTALDQLRKTGREFCKRTKTWREDLRPLNTIANQARYEILHDYDAFIFRLLTVKVNGTDYTLYNNKAYTLSENTDLVLSTGFIPTDTFADDYDETLTYSVDDVVAYDDLIYVNSEAITTPESFDEDKWQGDTTSKGIEIGVIFVPTYEATELPEWFIERYAEALEYGVISELMSSAGKPYTNPASYQLFRGKYRYETTLAMNGVTMNETHKASTVRG